MGVNKKDRFANQKIFAIPALKRKQAKRSMYRKGRKKASNYCIGPFHCGETYSQKKAEKWFGKEIKQEISDSFSITVPEKQRYRNYRKTFSEDRSNERIILILQTLQHSFFVELGQEKTTSLIPQKLRTVHFRDATFFLPDDSIMVIIISGGKMETEKGLRIGDSEKKILKQYGEPPDRSGRHHRRLNYHRRTELPLFDLNPALVTESIIFTVDENDRICEMELKLHSVCSSESD